MLQMKSCPFCNRTYSDISLSYCLNDGSLLSAPHVSADFQQNLFDETLVLENEIQTIVSKSNTKSKTQLEVKLENDRIYFSENFSVSFQRTLRIPDDGKKYPLPPGLGKFPICKVSDYADKVPASWKQHGGVFIPMYQREALWLDFDAAYWRPNAVKVAAGKINAVTGKSWNQNLSESEQDYMVCPPQKWLDGFKTGQGVVRQFIAMPLGKGYTVEEQLTGKDEFGGIQIIVFEPKEGKFPDEEPEYEDAPLKQVASMPSQTEMGLAAGGKIEQKIYPDNHGIDTWDEDNFGRVYIHIVNSSMFRQITGKEAPATPVTAETYTEFGLPWFEIYDEHLEDVSTGEELYTIKPVNLIDKMKGLFKQEDNLSILIPNNQVKKIKTKSDKIDDGEW